jgi:hypothetical protein
MYRSFDSYQATSAFLIRCKDGICRSLQDNLNTFKTRRTQTPNEQVMPLRFISLKIPNKILVTEEGVTKTFTCARTLVGQHVFLQLVGVEGSLSVCEVEVFTTNGKKWRRNKLVKG